MTRMITLDQEAVDQLMRDLLVQDYESIKAEQERLAHMPNPQPHHLEDLVYHVNLKDSMETVLSYYLPAQEYQKVVGKNIA